MSLINKMLRDLDARQAPTVDRAMLPRDVHIQGLPPETTQFPLPLVLMLAAAGGAAWYFLAGQGEPPALPAPSATVQQAPPPVAVLAPPPLPIPAEPVVPPQAPAAAASPPVVPPLPDAVVPRPAPATSAPAKSASAPAAPEVARKKSPGDNALRLDTRLPGTTAPAVVAPAPASPPVASPPLPPAKPVPQAKELSAPSGPTSIDKRPRTTLANDAAESEYRKAMSALRRGATSEAVEGLRGTLRIDAHHVSARQALLSLLVGQQAWGEAQAMMEEGLALDPEQTGWAMALARLQLENGKLPDAVETLARHARHADQNPDYQAFHALLLQKQKHSRAAAERYRAALALRPAESRWWYGLGLSLEADHKPQEAREAFLKAKETGNLPPELTGAVEQRLR